MKEESLETIIALIRAQVNTLQWRIHEIAGVPTKEVVCVWTDNLLTVSMKDNKPIVLAGVIAQTFTQTEAMEICRTVKNGHGNKPIMMAELDFCQLLKAKLICVLNETYDLSNCTEIDETKGF